MDGASKFVKGDAIAGIIITLINLIGGILIFSLMQGMGVLEALDRFGKLAIGDGLVSQIPSLLISVSSGIIVTRSDDDNTFGNAIKEDFFPNPLIAGIVACVMFIVALVPGFPKIPFFIMSGIFGFISFKKYESEDLEEQRQIERRQELLLLQKEKNWKKMIVSLLSK